MLFIISLVLLSGSVIFLNSIFRHKNIAGYFLSMYLLGYSTIILLTEFAGFVSLLSNQVFFLLLQTIFFALIVIYWQKQKRPSLLAPFQGMDLGKSWTALIESVRKYPITATFFMIVVSGYCVLAWLIFRMPPNNVDSMHTHLARIIYWLQQGNFQQLNTFSIFAQIYPFDANLNMLWTILFSGSDNFVGYIQFFSALVCAIAIYGICRILGGSKRAALIISLLWLTFPQNVFQATTTQNDLVVTALFITCLYFFFSFLKQREYQNLYFSGLALGLAFGTKETMFMVGLGIVIMLWLALKQDHTLWKPIGQWILVGLMSFILLGSYPYINNLLVYQNPFGPTEHVLGDSLGDNSLSEKFLYNTPRLLFQFLSIDALPVKIADVTDNIRETMFTTISEKLNVDLESDKGLKDKNKKFTLAMEANYNEDEAWFGPVSVLLLVPGFIFGTILSFRKKDLAGLSLAIFGITFFLCEIILRPGWDPYQGRYFILSTAIITPLSVSLINHRVPSRIYTGFLYGLACLIFFMSVFSNESKPLLAASTFNHQYDNIHQTLVSQQSSMAMFTKRVQMKFLLFVIDNLPFSKSIDDYDEIQLRTLTNLDQHEEILRLVEKSVPEDAIMGVILGGGTYDYIFFGEKLERRLISINPISLLYDEGWVNDKGLEYVLIYNQGRVNEVPTYLELISSVGDWTLYSVSASEQAN